MFCGQVGVATLLKKNKLVQEELVVRVALFSEERTPHCCQALSLNVPKQAKQFLAHAANDVLLGDLERRYDFPILQRLLLPYAFIALQGRATTLEGLAILHIQFKTKKFDDGRPRQQIDGRIALGFSAIQRNFVQLKQD